MRQGGVLAAAGLHALGHHRERLVEDHRRAQWLAREVAHPELAPASVPQSNIVLLPVTGARTAEELVTEWRQAGLLVSAFGSRIIRMVTHLDVDDDDCRRALEVIASSAARSEVGGSR